MEFEIPRDSEKFNAAQRSEQLMNTVKSLENYLRTKMDIEDISIDEHNAYKSVMSFLRSQSVL